MYTHTYVYDPENFYIVNAPMPHFCYGYSATSQGSLDWRKVDLSARPASSFRVICVLSFFIISYAFGKCTICPTN